MDRKHTKCANISFRRFNLVVLPLFTRHKVFFGVHGGAAMLVCSSPGEERKGLARDVFDTSATRAGFVCDVTATS